MVGDTKRSLDQIKETVSLNKCAISEQHRQVGEATNSETRRGLHSGLSRVMSLNLTYVDSKVKMRETKQKQGPWRSE